MNDATELRDALPVAIVVEKAAGLARIDQIGGEHARLPHVAIDSGGNDVDPIGKNTAQTGCAVALEGLECLCEVSGRQFRRS